MDDKTKIQQTRKLSLWNGKQVGPILPFLGNPEGTIGYFHGAVKVHWVGSGLWPSGLSQEGNVLLSGGGSFIPGEKEHPHRVLGRYDKVDGAPAVVRTEVGRGRVVLVNPYFIHDAEYLRQSLEGYEKYFPQHPWREMVRLLEQHTLFQQACFLDMLHALLQVG